MSLGNTAVSRFKRVAASSIFFVFLAAFALPSARAQTDASLSGIVHDTTGAGIQGATISIKNLETGTERDVHTDSDGRYHAPSLAVGRYELTADKAGFRTEHRTAITLVVGQQAEFDLTLQVGNVHQTLKSPQSPPCRGNNEDTSGLVGERQVKDLPLNGRSYDQLLTLNPGVVNYTSQRAGGIGTSNSVVGNMFAASGRRPQENLYLLNGVEFTSASEVNNTPGRSQRATSGRGRGARIRRGEGHLRRRIRQTPRRADQYRHRLGLEPVARQRLRVPAQQRPGRAEFLRSGATFPISSATSSADRWAGRSRRTRHSCSATTKASARVWG